VPRGNRALTWTVHDSRDSADARILTMNFGASGEIALDCKMYSRWPLRDLADRSSKHALEDGRVWLATKKDILRDELL
jgi:hypothetical protein